MMTQYDLEELLFEKLTSYHNGGMCSSLKTEIKLLQKILGYSDKELGSKIVAMFNTQQENL